jgi:uncharacterized membrane protein
MTIRTAVRGEISRLEGFSDAVFGFALTLLVVALEVPASFEELMRTMEGFLAFAICFAFIVWIWFEHYLFFRRFPLQDGLTVFYNAVLLFVVLFYVYPLKFLFSGLVGRVTGLGPPRAATETFEDGRALMVVYGIGCVAVFAGFVLLYAHARALGRRRGAGPLDHFDAGAGMLRHGATTAVALVAILLALLLPPGQLHWAGLFYSVLGPLHGVVGWRNGSRRAALVARLGTE